MSIRDRIEERISRSVCQPLERMSESLEIVLDSSAVVALLAWAEQTVGDIVRDSWLYRWLTAEPDPTVITIDLRETYTVGPVLALLERLVTPLWTRWEQSVLQEKWKRVADHGHRIVESSRVAAWLGRLFVPPEPPGDDESQTR